jgi:hypothetical protein
MLFTYHNFFAQDQCSKSGTLDLASFVQKTKNQPLQKKKSSPYWCLNKQSFYPSLVNQRGKGYQNEKLFQLIKPFYQKSVTQVFGTPLVFFQSSKRDLTRKGLSFDDNRSPFIIQPWRASLNKGVKKKKQYYLRSQKRINELNSLFKNQIYKLKKNQHDHSFFSYDNQINHFFKISLLFEIQQFYWKPLFLSNLNKNNRQRKKKKNHFFLALDQTQNNDGQGEKLLSIDFCTARGPFFPFEVLKSKAPTLSGSFYSKRTNKINKNQKRNKSSNGMDSLFVQKEQLLKIKKNHKLGLNLTNKIGPLAKTYLNKPIKLFCPRGIKSFFAISLKKGIDIRQKFRLFKGPIGPLNNRSQQDLKPHWFAFREKPIRPCARSIFQVWNIRSCQLPEASLLASYKNPMLDSGSITRLKQACFRLVLIELAATASSINTSFAQRATLQNPGSTMFQQKKGRVFFFFHYSIIFDFFLFPSFSSFLVYHPFFLSILEPKHEHDFSPDIFGFRPGRGTFLTLQQISLVLSTHSLLFQKSTIASNKQRIWLNIRKPFLFFCKDLLLEDLYFVERKVLKSKDPLFLEPLHKHVSDFNGLLQKEGLKQFNFDLNSNICFNPISQKSKPNFLMGWTFQNFAFFYLMAFDYFFEYPSFYKGFLKHQPNNINFTKRDRTQFKALGVTPIGVNSSRELTMNNLFYPKSLLEFNIKKNHLSLEIFYAKKTLFFGSLKRFLFFLQFFNSFSEVAFLEENFTKCTKNPFFRYLEKIKKKPKHAFPKLIYRKKIRHFFNNFNFINLSQKAIEYSLFHFFFLGSVLRSPFNPFQGPSIKLSVAYRTTRRATLILKTLHNKTSCFVIQKESLIPLIPFLFLREYLFSNEDKEKLSFPGSSSLKQNQPEQKKALYLWKGELLVRLITLNRNLKLQSFFKKANQVFLITSHSYSLKKGFQDSKMAWDKLHSRNQSFDFLATHASINQRGKHRATLCLFKLPKLVQGKKKVDLKLCKSSNLQSRILTQEFLFDIGLLRFYSLLIKRIKRGFCRNNKNNFTLHDFDKPGYSIAQGLNLIEFKLKQKRKLNTLQYRILTKKSQIFCHSLTPCFIQFQTLIFFSSSFFLVLKGITSMIQGSFLNHDLLISKYPLFEPKNGLLILKPMITVVNLQRFDLLRELSGSLNVSLSQVMLKFQFHNSLPLFLFPKMNYEGYLPLTFVNLIFDDSFGYHNRAGYPHSFGFFSRIKLISPFYKQDFFDFQVTFKKELFENSGIFHSKLASKFLFLCHGRKSFDFIGYSILNSYFLVFHLTLKIRKDLSASILTSFSVSLTKRINSFLLQFFLNQKEFRVNEVLIFLFSKEFPVDLCFFLEFKCQEKVIEFFIHDQNQCFLNEKTSSLFQSYLSPFTKGAILKKEGLRDQSFMNVIITIFIGNTFEQGPMKNLGFIPNWKLACFYLNLLFQRQTKLFPGLDFVGSAPLLNCLYLGTRCGIAQDQCSKSGTLDLASFAQVVSLKITGSQRFYWLAKKLLTLVQGSFMLKRFFILKKQQNNLLLEKKKTILLFYQTLLIPTKTNLTEHLRVLKYMIKRYNSLSSVKFIQKISPLIRSWCYYYRLISSEITQETLRRFLTRLENKKFFFPKKNLMFREALALFDQNHRGRFQSLIDDPASKSLPFQSDVNSNDFLVMKLLWKWAFSLLGKKGPLFLGGQKCLRHPNQMPKLIVKLFLLRKKTKTILISPSLTIEKWTFTNSFPKKVLFLRTKGLLSNFIGKNQNWIFVNPRNQRFSRNEFKEKRSLDSSDFKQIQRNFNLISNDPLFVSVGFKVLMDLFWSPMDFKKTRSYQLVKHQSKVILPHSLDLFSPWLGQNYSYPFLEWEKQNQIKQQIKKDIYSIAQGKILKGLDTASLIHSSQVNPILKKKENNQKQLQFLNNQIKKQICISLPKHSDLLLINHYLIKLEKSPYNFVDTEYWRFFCYSVDKFN